MELTITPIIDITGGRPSTLC